MFAQADILGFLAGGGGGAAQGQQEPVPRLDALGQRIP